MWRVDLGRVATAALRCHVHPNARGMRLLGKFVHPAATRPKGCTIPTTVGDAGGIGQEVAAEGLTGEGNWGERKPWRTEAHCAGSPRVALPKTSRRSAGFRANRELTAGSGCRGSWIRRDPGEGKLLTHDRRGLHTHTCVCARGLTAVDLERTPRRPVASCPTRRSMTPHVSIGARRAVDGVGAPCPQAGATVSSLVGKPLRLSEAARMINTDTKRRSRGPPL